jgi:hypothetical protein
MPDPIKMPAPPLAPGQVEVKLGKRRYVLNVDAAAEDRFPVTARAELPKRADFQFHRNAFALVWPALGKKPKIAKRARPKP